MLETLTTELRKMTCKRLWRTTAQYLLLNLSWTAQPDVSEALHSVEMEDSAAAAKAISELDGAEFFGSPDGGKKKQDLRKY